MIPKKIHYCWFGGHPLPKSAQKCIDSWRQFLPDYEIIQWDESNFDVNLIPYTLEAYKAKKYAFVSDYARFYIIREYGGIYFDTDVEIIRPFDDILALGGFMGYENNSEINPGLGFAAEPDNLVVTRVTEHYQRLHGFSLDGNGESAMTVVQHVTNVIKELGYEFGNNSQFTIQNITIYPKDWFNPRDSLTGKLETTRNTRSIHWYDNSWSDHSPIRTQLSRLIHRIFGINFSSRVKKMITR